MSDAVEHPDHYTQGPECPSCGTAIECRTVADWIGGGSFYLGNVVKYLWRLGVKGGQAKVLEDLRKARQNLDFQVEKVEKRRTEWAPPAA